MNFAIIGAGPIGGYAAYLLAKAGHSISIYENHAQVGCPIQCTGILTADFDAFGFPMDSYLVNTIDTIEVFTPHQKLAVKQKDYIVHRPRFDSFFVDMAVQAGARLFLSHSFKRKEGNSLIIYDSVQKQDTYIFPDVVIAADGPLSPTAKAYGFYHPLRENFYGIQATVKGKFEPNSIKTYFGNEVCPGLFAWVVPESKTIARVGLAALKNTKHYFDKFMSENGFVAKELQAGTIPVYHPHQKLQQGNCYVVGDAAGYVKATTLGGLVPGLQQAQALADSIIQGKKYSKEVKNLRRKMRVHLQVHKMLRKFSDQDWDTLVKYVCQPKVRKVFETYTRDNPLPLVAMTLLKEPRFFYFIKYFFMHKDETN